MSTQRSPGLGPPPRGLFGGGCLLPVIAIAAMALAGCSEIPAAEAPSAPHGYALLSLEDIPVATVNTNSLVVLCDTKRGNLIYLTPGYREIGIAVVPGGCKQ